VLAELSKLQDRIEPFNTLEARRMIEQELGQPIDVVFSEFSDKPIAAASLAQVGYLFCRIYASLQAMQRLE
jgi:ubiquinone biosynthesis protein